MTTTKKILSSGCKCYYEYEFITVIGLFYTIHNAGLHFVITCNLSCWHFAIIITTIALYSV